MKELTSIKRMLLVHLLMGNRTAKVIIPFLLMSKVCSNLLWIKNIRTAMRWASLVIQCRCVSQMRPIYCGKWRRSRRTWETWRRARVAMVPWPVMLYMALMEPHLNQPSNHRRHRCHNRDPESSIQIKLLVEWQLPPIPRPTTGGWSASGTQEPRPWLHHLA